MFCRASFAGCPRWLGRALGLAGAILLLAAEPGPRVTPQDFLPVSRLADAQKLAQAQGKPVGFLLTWPIYFPGAKDFHASGSQSTTTFYRAFKDQVVLVNVDHSTGELDHLPKAALTGFHSPAEGGFAPCLCLTDATCTRYIGIIPLWDDLAEKDKLFAQFRAVMADPKRWGEQPVRTKRAPTVAVASAPTTTIAPAAPVLPMPITTTTARALPPAPVSSGFAREMELTRQAEQRQAQKGTPSP